MITVFTPAYNRAKTLPRLFESLLAQTDKRFEWLVIDDGSTDNTEELFQGFMEKSDFEIRYIKRENWGLSQTLNQGFDLANGDIFFRIDSDDFVTPNAIEIIYSNWHLVEEDASLCGMVYIRELLSRSSNPCPFKESVRTDFFNYRNLYAWEGDMVEVVKTSVLRKFKLPKFGNEKFCPEGVMWNRIAKEYDAIYMPYSIYICEYVEDGLTVNVRRVLRNNPIGTSTFFSELFQHDNLRPLFYVKNAISYWRYAISNGRSWRENLGAVPKLATFIGLPVGLFLHFYDACRV